MRKSTTVAIVLFGFAGAVACSSSSSGLGVGGGDDTQPASDAGSGADGTIGNQDGAPVDSGEVPTDAGSDARAEPSCAGLSYCENFEEYDDAGAIKNNALIGPWKASVGGAAVMTIDGVHPYGGSKSLHITVPNTDPGANGILNQTAAGGLVTGNNLFGRAMVYYGTGGGADKPVGVHSWIFQGQGTSTASTKNMSLNLANHGDYYFLNYHGDTTAGAESSVTGGTPVAGAWVCMQWEYDGSGSTADEAKVWADGTLVVHATKAGQSWNLATPFTNFQFGFTHYQTLANAIDVYLDDFALDDTMIACPP
jgi:hypothetical protein